MSSPTNWTLYTSNEEAWNAMLADCAKAEKSIALEQYIFANDDYGKRMIEIVKERAAKGVEVRFLWDAVGSFTFMGSNITEELRRSGVRLLFWRTLIPGFYHVHDFRSWFLRNHRRTLVIDGKVGYTGSMCFKDTMKGWRDTNARFEGSIVAEMLAAFNRMWVRAEGKRTVPADSGDRDAEFSYVTNYPRPGKRHLYRTLVEAMRSAKNYIYITTPYFVPTHRLLRVIKLAAHRGVDVRLLLPERTNHYPALDLGARSYFTTLLRSGVRIFLYPTKNGEALNHGKAVVIDGDWATTGSMNMDNVSLLYNFEANVVTTNSKFAEELAAQFVHDMSKSREVDPAEWRSRFFIEKLPEFAIRIVRKFL